MIGPCKKNGVDCPRRWINTETLESCRTTCEEWQKLQKMCEEIRIKRHESALNRGYDFAHAKKRKTRRKKNEIV